MNNILKFKTNQVKHLLKHEISLNCEKDHNFFVLINFKDLYFYYKLKFIKFRCIKSRQNSKNSSLLYVVYLYSKSEHTHNAVHAFIFPSQSATTIRTVVPITRTCCV